jgi:hypothetical protein
VLNTYVSSRPNGYTVASLPLVFFGREGPSHHEIVFPLVWNWGDATRNTTIVANFYRRTDPDGWASGFVPLYFGSKRGGESYHLVPPLLLGVWTNPSETKVYAINTYVSARTNGFTLAFVPLIFAGREGAAHHEVVFPLFWNWGDATSNTTVVGTFFRRVDSTGWAAGLLPLYFGGRSGEDGYNVVPPLLLAHGWDADSTKTWFLNTYVSVRQNGYTVASLPLVFFGREGSDHHEIVFPLVWNCGDATRNTDSFPYTSAGDTEPLTTTWFLRSSRASGEMTTRRTSLRSTPTFS